MSHAMNSLKLLAAVLLPCATSLCASAQNSNSTCKTDSAERQGQPLERARLSGDVSPTTLIIWYDATAKANKRRLLHAVRRYKATVVYTYRNFNAIAIKLPDGADIDDAVGHFQKVKGVLQVNRDRIMHTNSYDIKTH